jgi:Icc-related predicted phosphoesterase
MIRFIGDVHGKIADYRMVRKAATCSIQVGDMGIGFVRNPALIADGHMFIRGNHDNPAECRARADHLGEYGITTLGSIWVFYVAGGYSRDQDMRTLGRDYWSDEEISYQELQKAIDLYAEEKPKVVVSHEAPISTVHAMGFRADSTRTNEALEAMLKIHQPQYWIYGHYHLDFREQLGKTMFIGLAELSHFDLKKTDVKE